MAVEPSGTAVYSPKIRDQALVRKFVSQGSRGYVAISIQDGATAVDPDEGTLSLDVWFADVIADPTPTNPWGTQILTITADSITKTDTGKYYVDLGPELTTNRGLLTAQWTYQVNGEDFSFVDHLQVLEEMPLYESLSDAEKSVCEQVSWMFGDLYDSTEGGPHLIEEFQTHWNYERLAQLQRIAVHRMNFIGNFHNPPTTWAVGTGKNAVPSQFAGLAVLGTYIEVMRHLRDSYTEIPARPGMNVTYTDRRDYWQRWAANLQTEEEQWKQWVRKAKSSLLSFSRGSLLVAGGIYGGSALGIFQAGTYSAQVRSWRMYPAAPAIMWGATRH